MLYREIAHRLYENEPKFKQVVESLLKLAEDKTIPRMWLPYIGLIVNEEVAMAETEKWWQAMRKHKDKGGKR